MRHRLLSVVVAGLTVTPASAVIADMSIEWAQTTPESGEVVGDEVHVTGAGTHLLLTLDTPGVEGDSYVVKGSVRYESVGGVGYMEMWSHFADGGAYFSRTLAVSGPMALLTGDSPERDFELPFFLNGADGPVRVEINVVLPEGGDVWIGALELVGFGDGSQWWTSRVAGVMGALVGTIAGLAGALVGLLASRQRARRVVRGLLIAGTSLGTGASVVGIVALALAQPFHVWFPLLLIGVILALVNGLLMPTMNRIYAVAELHRIHALDTGPG